jgi:methyl-accepting chemotaxis protein
MSGQILVKILLDQIAAFETGVTKAGGALKKLGTDTGSLSGSLQKVDSSMSTTATKTQDLATKTGQLSQKAGELKPKTDQAATGAENLGNKAQKAGTDLQTMGTKTQSAGQSLSGLGDKFKQSALAIAGFSTSLFNTYMQYDSIKDQELQLKRNRDTLDKATAALAIQQRKLNEAHKDGKIEGEAYTDAQTKLTEQAEILKTREEQYTDAVQDHANAWKGFALSLAPTIITGLAAIQGFMGKTGASALGATSAVKGFGSGAGATMLRIAPFALGIGGIVTAFLAIKNNTFGARDALEGFGKSLGDAMPALVPVLSFIEQLGGFLGLAGDRSAELKTKFLETMGGIGASLGAFAASVQTAFTQFTTFIQNIISLIEKGDVIGAFTTLGIGIKDAFIGAFNFVTTDLVPAVTSFITFFQENVIDRLPDLITAIIEGIGNAWEWTQDVIDTIWEAFQEEVATWFDDNAKGMVEKWIESILKAFGWSQKDIDKAMEGFTKFMKAWAEDPKKALYDLGKVIAEKVIGGLDWAAESLATIWNKNMTPLLTTLSKELQKLDFKAIGDQIGTLVGTAINWVFKAADALFGGKWNEFAAVFEGNLETAKKGSAWSQMGASIAQAIVDIVKFGPEMFANFWTGFVEAAMQKLGTLDYLQVLADIQQGKTPKGEIPQVGEQKLPLANIPPSAQLSKKGAQKEQTQVSPLDWLGAQISGGADWLSKNLGILGGGPLFTGAFAEEEDTGSRTLSQMINAALVGYPPGGKKKQEPSLGLGSMGGAVTGTGLDAFTQQMAQKTTEISAMFLTMKESIIGTMTELQTFLGNFASTVLSTMGTAISTQTTTISSYFLTMKESITIQLVELQTLLGAFSADTLTTIGTAVSTQTTLISSYFLTMKESILLQLTELTTLLTTFSTETLITIGTAVTTQTTLISAAFLTMKEAITIQITALTTLLNTFVTTTLKTIATTAGQQTTLMSAHFLTMKESIDGTLQQLTETLTSFVDETLKTFADDASIHTTSVSGSFLAMRESTVENLEQIMDAIDDLIEKMEELEEAAKAAAEAQDEVDGGGGGGGGSSGGSGAFGWDWRYGGSFVMPRAQHGTSFLSTRDQTFRGHRISELNKWERVDITPLSNPFNAMDKNSRIFPQMMQTMTGGGRPIIVQGNINAVLVTQSGREIARTSSPYILEYSEASF